MSEVILMIEPKDVIERTLLDGNIDNKTLNAKKVLNELKNNLFFV